LLEALLTALLALPPDELSWLIYYRLPGALGEKLRDRMNPENRPRFSEPPRINRNPQGGWPDFPRVQHG
jgi:hypothetical protein